MSKGGRRGQRIEVGRRGSLGESGDVVTVGL